MSNSVLAILGIASGALNLASIFPYVRDILRGKTQPERATWWIWFALNCVSLSALIDAGATWSLALNIGQQTGVGIVALLSLRYGYGKFQRRHFISFAVAALGIVLWQVTNQPLYAVLIVIAVDAVGMWLILNKAWHAPQTETLSTWVVSAVSAAIGIAAVGEINFTKMLYPAYIAFCNATIMADVMYRRRKLGKQSAVPKLRVRPRNK